MKCKICGNSDNNRSHYPKEMMLGLRDKHHYFECGKCSCLQIASVPENLPDYYPDNYYSYKKNSTSNPFKKVLIKLRDKYAVLGQSAVGHLIYFFSPEPKLATLKELSLNHSSRIMDVGCGAGNLLHSLKEIGFTHLLGIDPFNESDIKYENGLLIEKKSIHESSGEWDLIMFHHSFEHVYDQHEVLQKVHSLLAPNGSCLLRVPTTSSYAWIHYGLDWVQLDAPRHLFLHSVESMQLLAEKNGFKLERVIYDSNALQFWGSEQYKQDIPLRAENSYAENNDGRSKLAGEKAVLSFAPKNSLIIRTSWLYSAHGNNFVKSMLQLMKDRDALGIVADQIGSPTWAKTLAKSIWKLEKVNAKGIYHCSDNGVASWYDFSVSIQKLAVARGLLDKEIPIKAIRTKDYPTPATRPPYSIMDKTKTETATGETLPHWQQSLDNMLKELKT